VKGDTFPLSSLLITGDTGKTIKLHKGSGIILLLFNFLTSKP
jgi:hypothetical protein